MVLQAGADIVAPQGIPDQKRLGKDCITDLHELQSYVRQLLEAYPAGFNLSTLKRKIKAKSARAVV